MTVQTQFPYSRVLSPDFCDRDDAQMMEMMMQDPRSGPLLQLRRGLACLDGTTDAAAGKQQKQQLWNNGTVFSDPQSELTCNNVSGGMKRPREESAAVPLPAAVMFSGAGLAGATENPAGGVGGVCGVLPGQSRLLESAAASTSGRFASLSPPSNDLVSLFYQQNLEIDALCRLETERLVAGLEQARKRHCRGLLSTLEQQAAKRMMEKEAELENARRRNADLEEKLRQMTEENQIWFGMARNSEAVVCSLRASLEQALLQGTAAGAREGYGDSDGAEQSCCFEQEDPAAAASAPGEAGRRSACRRCGDGDVGVLLLPCKHLCLCKDCEPAADSCPVCGESKSACLQILMC